MSTNKTEKSLPKAPFNTIAISLSGGGFRATAFHLGALSYLSTKKWNNCSLLERIRVLSTVSGGTFTGVKYASMIKQGKGIAECYSELYQFMSSKDLVDLALQYLSDDNNWKNTRQRNLINSFAAVYHAELEIETLGLLWQESPSIHLKEISFNATEFNFAIPFRFQKTEKSKGPNNGYTHGFIGNNNIRLPLEIAKDIRLADIIASSSCFPLGFEPINFPDDFVLPKSAAELQESLPKETFRNDPISYPVGLMDGGIDDNQGIDAVLLAEKRMQNYEQSLQELKSDDERSIDLYIVSDVSSPYIDEFIRSAEMTLPMIGNWTLRRLRRIGIGSSIIGAIGMGSAIAFQVPTGVTISLSVVGTCGISLGAIIIMLMKKLDGLIKKGDVPEYFEKKLKGFDRLKVNTLYTMVANRMNSAKTMVAEVFMKRMRALQYDRLYKDEKWRPRLIMNAVHELTSGEVGNSAKKERKVTTQPDIYAPSKAITTTAEKASSMGTTLWFTPEQLEGADNMLNTLIACGQSTICWNLIEYIEKIRQHKDYATAFLQYDEATKEELKRLSNDLMEDWKRFQSNPYWMVEEWNKNYLTM